MILESKVGQKVVLIDCEAAGGIDKGEVSGNSDPDKVLESASDLLQTIASNLAPTAAAPGVEEVELHFGLCFSNNGLVYVATTAEKGQIQVRMRLDGTAGGPPVQRTRMSR